LATIVAFLKPQSIVEFGTYLGASALTFMLNAPAAKLLTIDLPDEPGDISNLPPVDKDHVASSRNMIGKWYKGTAQEARIQQLQCDSRSLDLSKYVERADLVLIDGGHDVECVSADTKNAFKVIRSGGVVLWDDYFWLYPDVVEFLDELSSTHELACIQGTNLVAHLCR
nr:class I SAM-dependent methyltransferase [Acidobacteriota bacterium]